jgi:hypothetical protein
MIPLYDLIQIKYPAANIGLGGNVELCDHGLGKGPEIGKWLLEEPQPTLQELDEFQNDPKVKYKYQIKQNKISNIPIIEQLKQIDLKSIPALRVGDTEYLDLLEREAVKLRAQLLPETEPELC